MRKIKIISACLAVLLIILMVLTFLKIKQNEEYKQKIVLAQEIHKVLGFLMFDLRDARESALHDVPADGLWHEGGLGYFIKGEELFRTNNGTKLLIADNIADLRIRRQINTPGILEVQIEARKNVSLMSYLKVRIRD